MRISYWSSDVCSSDLQVEMAQKGDNGPLTIRAGRSTFTLQCLPPADFPAMAKDKQPHSFSLTATEHKDLIDHTRFAISKIGRASVGKECVSTCRSRCSQINSKKKLINNNKTQP